MRRMLISILAAAASVVAAGQAWAEAFGDASYDANSDALVVTMLYSGTNPDHEFSLQWGKCTKHPDGSMDVAAEVIDSQGRDAVSQEFKKTVRLSLAGLPCRPATVTLHSWPTAYIAVRVPAAPSA